MSAMRGDLSEYREFEPGRWRRENAKGEWIEEDGVTTVSRGVTFAEVYKRRANPPTPEPDPRDAKIAELEAAVAALKRHTGVSDEMVAVERSKPIGADEVRISKAR